jgi:hypothetical protein
MENEQDMESIIKLFCLYKLMTRYILFLLLDLINLGLWQTDILSF